MGFDPNVKVKTLEAFLDGTLSPHFKKIGQKLPWPAGEIREIPMYLKGRCEQSGAVFENNPSAEADFKVVRADDPPADDPPVDDPPVDDPPADDPPVDDPPERKKRRFRKQ